MTVARHRGIIAGAATLLATAPLATIFEGWGWLMQCLVAVAAVTGTALAARALRAPVWGQVLAMLGALGLVLTWLFPSGEEFLGILPTATTLQHYGTLLGEVPTVVRDYAIPVPDLDSLQLLTVAGVGLVAVLVDLCVVGLRRPALAGLPMLAIYSVPVAVAFDSVPVLLFAIGAVGFLWLLSSDNVDRVRRFGRRFTGDGRDVDLWEPSPLAAAGRRLAVVGVLVAVALPAAVPGMTSGLVDRFGPGLGPGTGSGPGSGQVNLFAELYGELNRDETVDLVEITTDDPDPFYLRLATAGRITDTGFAPSPPEGEPVTAELPEVDPGVSGPVTYHEHSAEVELTDAYAMSLAPTYERLTGIAGLDSRWRYDPDQRVVHSDTSAAGLSYGFTYRRPEYDPAVLRRTGRLPEDHPVREQFTDIPDLPRVQELLDGIVDEADAPYDQVRDILGFFSRENDFRYDLTTGPETDAPAIVDFLENRAGFCVQYASAMAWLVRSIDMPARVAFGFTRGGGSAEPRVLTNRNLHAWTEVYFDGFGWVPFDATPSTPLVGAADPEWAPDPDAPDDPGTDDPQDPTGPDATTSPSADPSQDPSLPTDEGIDGALPAAGQSSWPQRLLAAGALVLALLTLPALRRVTVRRRRVSTGRAGPVPEPSGTPVTGDASAVARRRAHRAWDELLDTMVDCRIPLDPAESPRTTAERLRGRVETDADAYRGTQLLARAEERARYAPAPSPPDGLAVAVAAVRRALLTRAGARSRLRAVLMPPSTLLRWRLAIGNAVTRVLAGLGRAGELLARLSPRHLLRTAR